jgi:NADPH:quinone reductase-like Zn-dependent oxidoreductase
VRAFAHELGGAFDDGRLRPVIDAVMPVDLVAEAFDRLAGSGKVGKVLLAF